MHFARRTAQKKAIFDSDPPLLLQGIATPETPNLSSGITMSFSCFSDLSNIHVEVTNLLGTVLCERENRNSRKCEVTLFDLLRMLAFQYHRFSGKSIDKMHK